MCAILVSLLVSSSVACSKAEPKEEVVNSPSKVEESIVEESEALDKEETSIKVESSSGKLSAEAIPLFEKLYETDKDRELKINFAKSSLSDLDKAVELLPEGLKKVFHTSGKLIVNEGPTYDYNFIASDKKLTGGKTDNFQFFDGGVMFNDSKESLSVRSEWHLTFKLVNETEISLSAEAIAMLGILAPELTVDTIESSMKSSLANKGKSQYLVEEKNRYVTVGANVYENSNTVSIFGETRKDY